MADRRYPVVIMAGGPTPRSILESGESEKERAFLDVGGRPMLDWVLDAIRGCGCIGEIIAVGNRGRMMDTFGLDAGEAMEQKTSMLENFMAGMEHFRSSERVMVVTCDIPLITPSVLDELAAEIDRIDAEVYYPIVDVDLFDKKYPGSKRTTQKLKEGTFTGGNIFVLNPEAVIRNRTRMEAIIRDRKSPAKLIKLMGLGFILKFAFRMLDLKGLEAKATEILGAKMRGVIAPWPEIGLDVDKAEDLLLVRKVLGNA